MSNSVRADITFGRLGPRVATAIRPDGGWFVNNAGWIVGDRSTLIIDTFASEMRTMELLDAVDQDRRRLGAQDTNLQVVLTHAHGDHANGASLLEAAGATIFASEHTGSELLSAGIQTYPGFLVAPQWGSVCPPKRFSPIAGAMTFDLGGVVVEVESLTGPAHSEGDVIVKLPGEDILFAGDLVWNQITPLAISGSVSGWLDQLDIQAAMSPTTIVPGHGGIRGPELIDSTRRYLSWILGLAGRQVAGDELNDQAISQLRSELEWDAWPCPERDGANLVRAVADLTGAPFSFAEALNAMQRRLAGPVELLI